MNSGSEIRKQRGFSLIELLLVIALVAVIGLSSVAFYSRFFTQNAVGNTIDQLTSELRKAQMYAMTGKKNGAWGVHKGTNQIILFQGNTYATRNTAFDEVFAVNSNITITGLTDIIFVDHIGTPSATGTITVSGSGNSEAISINSQGVISNTAVAASTWFNTSYLYKKKITIDRTKVSGGTNLTNFPVLISLTDADLKTTANGGYVNSSNGYDIIFTDDTETTLLDHEIEKYTPTTGATQMWVRIPTLSVSSDTVIYVYFGNNAIGSSQEHKTTVWDSNYKGVWHLKENPAIICSGTSEICDSTISAANGDAVNLVAGDQVTGKIDGSMQFTGDTIAIPSLTNSITNFTLQAWINPSTVATDNIYRTIYCAQSGCQNYYFQVQNAELECGFNGGTSNHRTTGWIPSASTWYLVACTFNTTTNRMQLYANGVQLVDVAETGTPTNANSLWIGSTDGSSSESWQGIIDEPRISIIDRSAGWIATEYNNQNSPATFFSVGAKTGQ